MEAASTAAPSAQDLEDAFAELQEVLKEQTEVEDELHKLEDLDEGDAEFDELVQGYHVEGHVDPPGAAFAYTESLVAEWKARHEQLLPAAAAAAAIAAAAQPPTGTAGAVRCVTFE